MADKKLNEVQKVTDMAYVPVIMADGSIGQIAKADLASVVAGVMRKNRIELESLSTFIRTAINNISSLETGIHQVPTGGPVFHAIVFRYSEGFYSAILSSYGPMDELPLYVRFDGNLHIRSLS